MSRSTLNCAGAIFNIRKTLQDYKNGKKAAAGFFVGQVMKLSKGKADPKIVGGLV